MYLHQLCSVIHCNLELRGEARMFTFDVWAIKSVFYSKLLLFFF